MQSEPEELIHIAQDVVARARQGDYRAGMETVAQSAIAIRGILTQALLPDSYRMVYLARLLESLEAIENGDEPQQALSLTRPTHRLASDGVPMRNGVLFAEVGNELDKLLGRGHTRGDSPVESAITTVAKRWRVSEEVVGKAWRSLGAVKGWNERRDDWNDEVET